ncbi:HNH endonuclease [Pseudomonas sp. KSR10]|nr:HNH endonuclease [Pseudomonas sp. KSR10]MCG6541736.1 HNH endonuclease [Pseudomonas sp. KSR10]
MCQERSTVASDRKQLTSAGKGYGYRWQKARADHLRRNPLCMFCQQAGRSVPASVVDHVTAPRLGDAKLSGDPERIAAAWKLFWDRANWQSLCKCCHDSTKQRLEKSGRVAGCGADGRPVDPRHHWNRLPAGGQG